MSARATHEKASAGFLCHSVSTGALDRQAHRGRVACGGTPDVAPQMVDGESGRVNG